MTQALRSSAYPMETPAMPKRPHLKTPQKSVTDPAAGEREARQARLLQGNLAHLLALEANGLDAEASDLVDKIDAGLRRQRPALVPQAPTAAELPAHERGRGVEELKRLDRLNARLARPDLSEKQRQAAIDERAAMEQGPAKAADQAWRDQAANETVALAANRGESADRLSSGAVRVNNRDAVYSLARKLSPEQYDAAVEARDCYESRSPGLGSQMGGLAEAGSAEFDSNAAAFAGIQRAKKLQRLGNIERGVLIGSYRMTDGTLRLIAAWKAKREGSPLPHVALTMLRGVCGQNIALSAFGEGRSFERNLAALKLALDVADEIIRGR